MRSTFLIKHSSDYIVANKVRYLIVLCCLLGGIVIGSLSGISLDSEVVGDVKEYLQNFISAYSIQNVNKNDVFLFSVCNNLKTALFIWISGWWIGFVPLCLFQVGLKGYKIGFTTTLIVSLFRWKGVLMGVMLLIQQVIIIIPVVVAYAVYNMKFSSELYNLRKNGYEQINKKYLYVKNILFLVVVIALLCVCGLVDGFVTPAVFNLYLLF